MAHHILRFRKKDKDTFLAIARGEKSVETRAATKRYVGFVEGDTLTFVCGTLRTTKTILRKKHFKTLAALFRAYAPGRIMPGIKNERELRKMYYSFPQYREKLRRYGVIAWELKR